MTVLFRRGLRPANGEVDRKLWQWYSDTSLQQGTKVSKRVVQARAKWAFHQAGITDFKASDGWYRRWVKRCQNFSPDQLSKVCSIEPELPSSSTLSTRCETPSSKNVEGGSISTNESISQEKSVDMQQVAEEANRETESIEPCCSSSISDQTSESNAMLSTPMLNIVDYLPPEVMHSLHGSTLSSDSLESVFAGPSMDSLYYPEHNMLSDCDNFHLDLQHSDSYPCSIPTTTEADRLKDIVGLISSQSNTSSGLLRDNDNVVSTCSSDNEDFVNSIFKDVGFHMDVQVGINSEGSSVNVPEMTSTVSQDVLSPEVILESHADTRRNPEAVEPASKKSKKSVVQHRKKGERYLPQFKVKVLAYAASHTLRETAKKFKVNDGTISSWKKEKDWKRQLTQNRKKVQTPVSHPVDQQFLTWLRRCREQGREVTAGEVKDKARQIMGQSSTDNCHWYKLWVSRFDEEQVYREGLEREKSKQEHHIQYPQAFKMEVAVFAQLHSQIVAARTFNVSRKRVFEWLQLHRAKHTSNEAESSERSCERVEAVEEITSKKLGSRRSDTDKEIDQEIWEWYQTQQTRGSKPTWHEVQAKGLELYRCKGNENIKCSYRWYKRWCDRFHVILRHEGDDAMLEWALTQLELGNSLSHNDLQVHALTLASDTAFKPGHKLVIHRRFDDVHLPRLQS
ncbi:hypothetical protein ANN_07929 [Periplaneta americana]|uniref:HTH CENPB-type domain-containing protein n=1 Tax=Periplaneta americana TaxID=6978 RepID=A0ABQ8T1D7_PERAM|nr:hypothetical protein ANN_07929 [Periplaneta americana]